MGEARRKKAVGEGIRVIPMKNGQRGGLLQVLRERVASEGKDAKEGIYRAIAAIAFDEDERDAIDERNERLQLLQEQISLVSAPGGSLDRLTELQAERKELVDENKKWRKAEQEVTVSAPTLAKIVEEFWAAKGIYGRGVEDLMPLITLLEEAKSDASPYNPARVGPASAEGEADAKSEAAKPAAVPS